IFDLDGTLADSMRVWDRLCGDWLLAKGKIPPESLGRDIAVMTLEQSAEYIIREFGIGLPAPRVIEEWLGAARREYEETVALKEGAAELISAMAKKGMRIGIATSCFPGACEALLQKNGVSEHIGAIVYSNGTLRDKTWPDIWLECAVRLGVTPEDCVAFEDLRAAGKGIRRAGMAFVAVYDKSNREWDKMRAEADIAVLSLGELRF
ncbi:MAG: HAD family phosphatase, partial [Oscillospiraceae bacterium]|nr:HAD family phosphatase [Oscillospiraceae bacterium]